jgi:hypothetical protein
MAHRSDDDDYEEDDDKPVEPRKKRKKFRPPIATPMRPLVWAILGLLCCWTGPITVIIGSMVFFFAKAAEDELPESSRADSARQMMFLCKIAGIVEICLGIIGIVAGIILKITDKTR